MRTCTSRFSLPFVPTGIADPVEQVNVWSVSVVVSCVLGLALQRVDWEVHTLTAG
jgi:hypothetical protein